MRGYFRSYGSLTISVMLAVLLSLTTVALFFTYRDESAYETRVSSSIREISAIRDAEFDLLNVQRQSHDDMLDGHDDFTPAEANAAHSLDQALKIAQGRETFGLVREFVTAAKIQNDFWKSKVANPPITAETRLEGEKLTEEALFASNRVVDADRRFRGASEVGIKQTRERVEILYTILFSLILSLFAVMAYLSIEVQKQLHLVKVGEKQKLLTDELNHRVKNLISVCQSIASQTYKSLGDNENPEVTRILKERYKTFEKRMLALSSAHRLLMKSDSEMVSMGNLLDETLRPLVEMHRIDCQGPTVWLTANSAITMNLLFHELATNSLKYGAFSNDDGHLVLNWKLVGKEIDFVWQERNGPIVVEPTQRGFGSKLVETAAMREMGGKAVMEFNPSGFVYRMVIPLSDKVKIDENPVS